MENGAISVKTFSKGKIEFGKELGSGSFGKVVKGVLRDSNGNQKHIAVKVFYQDFIGTLPNVDSKLRTSALDELAKVAVLDHENIVKLLGMVEDGIPWLVFEYMKDGNLLEYVMRKKENVKEKTLIRYCRDVCNGMSFLHQNNFLHKDLAARNILLDGKTAKIADLGLCSFLTEEQDGSYALGGKLFPYRHAASECIIESIYTFESDVWSFGVLLFEIFTGGAVPYGAQNKQPEVRRFIAEGLNPTHFLTPTCCTEIQAVMDTIFRPVRQERPNFSSLFSFFEALLLPEQKGNWFSTRPRRGSSTQSSVSPPRSEENIRSSTLAAQIPAHLRLSNSNLLGVNLNFNTDRRFSEIPDIPRRGSRPDVLIEAGRGERSASFSRLQRPNLIKGSNPNLAATAGKGSRDFVNSEFVPNRFNKK